MLHCTLSLENQRLVLLVVGGVPFFASGHVLGGVTPLSLVVVDLAGGAAQGTGLLSV